MAHIHVAGEIHADAGAGPQWLSAPEDLNALDPGLWSRTVHRGDDGALVTGGVSVVRAAEELGTPVYLLDEEDFRARARAFRAEFDGWRVFYAGKAFLCRRIVRWAMEEGLWLDVCSGGELAVALDAGADPAHIGFHGNNKTVEELATALEHGVGRIIVDSLDEIARIETLCAEHDWRAHVMVRVNPGVEAHTHEYIATAHEDQKFGFSIATGAAFEAAKRLLAAPGVDLLGLHSHIGSQIFDTAGHEVAAPENLRGSLYIPSAPSI